MDVLLGVSGSISCYKACDLVRALVRDGHRVKVVLTRGASEFVGAGIFRSLGALAAHGPGDDFRHPPPGGGGGGPVLHVELARWAHKLVLAPLSADTAARLAQGRADDLLGSVFLAFPPERPLLVFPAMNVRMLEHPFTKANLEALARLRSLGNAFVHPTDEGALACEDEGRGRLPDVEEVADLVATAGGEGSGVRTLVAAGATVSPIDPVRFVSNPSTGLTGYHCARACLAEGHEVAAVVGGNATDRFRLLARHPRFRLVRVVTTQEMLDAVSAEFDACDLYITPAAIADLECDMRPEKIRKRDFDHRVEFRPSPDILAAMLGRRRGQVVVGFAAETDPTEERLREKFARKPVDLLVGTRARHDPRGTEGFGADRARYRLFDGRSFEDLSLAKSALAAAILDRVRGRLPGGKAQKTSARK